MSQFNTVEEALADLRAGKIILVTDDPDRENEGDFICAAQFATTENINFMATHGKGLICMPMSAEFVEKLQIPQMVSKNTDNHETAFTVSIDAANTTTGISAAERSMTATAPAQVLRYVVEKGSIAIDGISLTVARVETDRFAVSVIPHTAAVTLLGQRRTGDRVNLESDLVGKYVERLLRPAPEEKGQESKLTMEFLSQHGF